MFFSKKVLPVTLSNTLSGKKELFISQKKGRATLYSCGPTVYGPQHIGNLRAAVFSDTLARALAIAGYDVQKVVNITDVGHLVGDGDEGEDKMAIGATREQVSPKEIAKKYANQYLADIRALGIDTRHIRFPRATDYIREQIAMIETLLKHGHAYVLPDGVYFDTSTFPTYGVLGNQKEVAIEAGARVEMVEGKKHPRDFVLWRVAKPNDLQKWPSPWGDGNPGWSIECSAMATTLLGATIDIHTGGEDHIAIHHNNEIAQSEGATGKAPFARYWLHNAFLTIEGEKISKSLGNTYVLDDVKAKGMHPLALRYLFMQAHYSSPLSFSWESLTAAHTALHRLWKEVAAVREASGGKGDTTRGDIIRAAILDDLSTPTALKALYADLGNHSLTPRQKWGVIEAADEALGLSLVVPPEKEAIPEDIKALGIERDAARTAKDYEKSDALRRQIEGMGYTVNDTEHGTEIEKK